MRHTILATLLLAALPAAAQAPDPSFGHPARFLHRDGAALYAASCAGCHMPDGRGAMGAAAYPALAGNDRLDPPGYLVTVILRGRHGMPGFAGSMNDEQVAAVASFVRTNFGNAWSAPVTPEEARTAR
jgi:mono/diheme cytochrome c family protein